GWTFARAQEGATNNQPAMTTGELLRVGIEQYNKKQYEVALSTLQQIKPEDLSESDRKTLATYLQNAEAAANQRKNARSEFQMGETAMQKNAPAEALTHYKAAANSKYVDSGTREKALEKAAMAQSSLRNS